MLYVQACATRDNAAQRVCVTHAREARARLLHVRVWYQLVSSCAIQYMQFPRKAPDFCG